MTSLLPYLPLGVLLAAAVVIDWRERRIPNWLNALTFVGGVAAVAGGIIPVSAGGATLAVAIAIGLVLPRVLLGATGAGDLKQHMAVAVWLGPLGIVAAFMLSAVAGMIVAAVQAYRSGKLKALLHNSAVLSMNLVHARTVGVDHIQQTGTSFRSVDKPLPYAVPMMIGTAIVVVGRCLMGV